MDVIIQTDLRPAYTNQTRIGMLTPFFGTIRCHVFAQLLWTHTITVCVYTDTECPKCLQTIFFAQILRTWAITVSVYLIVHGNM